MKVFDNWYWEQYPDVADARIPPFRHWVKYGRKEGRALLPPFWYFSAIKRLKQISYSNYIDEGEKNRLKLGTEDYNKIRITRTNFYQIDLFLESYVKELMKIKKIEILYQEGNSLKLIKNRNRFVINLPEKKLLNEFEIELLNHLINVEKIINLNFDSNNVYDRFIEIVHRDLIRNHHIKIFPLSKYVN